MQNQLSLIPFRKPPALQELIEQGHFAGGRGICPECDGNNFCLKKDESLARCFTPGCEYYLAKHSGIRTSVYADIADLLDEFFRLCKAELLRHREEPGHHACRYLAEERRIDPKIIELSMLGILPGPDIWKPQMKDRWERLQAHYSDKYRQVMKEAEITEEEVRRIRERDKNRMKLTAGEKAILETADPAYKDLSVISKTREKFESVFQDCHKGWLLFFYTDRFHSISQIKGRKPYSKDIITFKPWKTKSGFFNHGLFIPGQSKYDDTIILTEGEINTLQLQSLAVRNNLPPVFAASWGGAASLNAEELKETGWKPIICHDNDDAGRKVIDRLKKTMTFQTFTTPLPGSDLDSYIISFEEDYRGAWEGVKSLIEGRRTVHFEPVDLKWAMKPVKNGGYKILYPEIGRYFADRYSVISMAGNLYRYEKGIYEPDCGRMAGEVQRLLAGESSNYGINEVMSWLLRCNVKESDDLDMKAPEFINLENGMLEWKTGKLHPHGPEYLSTIRIPVTYDPEARCPEIEAFLKAVLAPENIPIIEELAGYLLIPSTALDKCFIFTGAGANGKSTLIDLLTELIGRGNVSNLSLQDLAGENDFLTARLRGKLANLYPDLDSRMIKYAGKLKSIVSGDRHTAQEKFRPPFEFRPFARLIFSCNQLPGTSDNTYGFWRRIIVLPFCNRFEGKDRISRDELNRRLHCPWELSGFLNLALMGLKRLMKRGAFSESASTERLKGEYQEDADPVRSFVGEDCILKTGCRVERKTLYEAYKSYCFRIQAKPLSDRKFYARLGEVFKDVNLLNSHGVRYFGNIGLIDCES